ncbi:MAG: discoidin domain-containing protein [Isosphaeraceae bacterium]
MMRPSAKRRRISARLEILENRALPSTLVALVDTGVDLNSAWCLPYYDLADGYDAYHEQTVAQYGPGVIQDTSAQHGHGSQVADYIVQGIKDTQSQPGAQKTNIEIMPIRDTSGGSTVDSTALVRGVYWAVDHGASVINLSVSCSADPILNDPGDPHNGSTLSQAIAYAQSKGAVVVTGSGNQAIDIDRLVTFPSYASDPVYTTANPPPTNLIVAAAVDSSGDLTPESNWGPIHVTLGAYCGSTGYTSFSSGYTSGVAGVIAAMLPADQAATDVITDIESTVTPHAQSVGAWCQTGGVIDPTAAVVRLTTASDLVDAGGPAAGSYSADVDFQGGSPVSTTQTVGTNAVASPAPEQVYQTERQGNFTYTMPGLLPNVSYTVRLDFVDFTATRQGQRLMNVLINGTVTLANFDIYGEAGGIDKAISRQFLAVANSSGQVVIQFVTVAGSAEVSGIAVTPAPDLALGRPAYASSIESQAYTPAMAVDGNSQTRWSSGQWLQNTSTAWITIDLGSLTDISRVTLDWERAYAVNYQIRVSKNSTNWTTIENVSGNNCDGVADFQGLSGVGRYIRIYCTQVTTEYDNFSLYEIQVYGTPVTDLALNQPAYASSIESPSYAPAMAVDGNGATRWSSGQWMQNTSTAWIYVDLGIPVQIAEIQLDWERAYAVNYQIQVSNDATSWTTIQSVTGNNSGGVADFGGLSSVGRYVRIDCTQVSAQYDNFSLYDFEVFGAPLPDLALNQPAYASSVESPSYAPAMAVDGNGATRWSSGQWLQNTSTAWIYVDLGSPVQIAEIQLDWERAYAVNYQVQVSNDATSWSTIQSVTGNNSGGVADFGGLSSVGRYVRIDCTQVTAQYDNFSLYEVQVYGTPVA